jgi:hypothetical protein
MELPKGDLGPEVNAEVVLAKGDTVMEVEGVSVAFLPLPLPFPKRADWYDLYGVSLRSAGGTFSVCLEPVVDATPGLISFSLWTYFWPQLAQNQTDDALEYPHDRHTHHFLPPPMVGAADP